MAYRSSLLAAAGFAGLALAAHPARAEAPAEELMVMAAAEVSGVDVLGEKTRYRAKATATATKTDTPLRDVPQAVSVITEGLIRDQGMQGMADLVRYVPGVALAQGEGNRDTPVLRGNSSTADFFVDGVRDDVQYVRDLYNAERVEVLKGPNAMIFGRGGGGGVINRVTKQADWRGARSATLELGSWDHRRLTADLDQPLSDSVAGRVVGLYERSESYRDGVFVERWGINPTLAWRPSSSLSVRAGYEHFEDRRTADRGIPSFAGRPAPTDTSTFFGDPDRSYVSADVDLLNATVEYAPNDRLTVRNRTLYGDYDKFYQNVFASGEAKADAPGIPAFVPISAYNNATQRQNLFNQTDVILKARTGSLAHTLLVGAELGRQVTDNLRTTGFFNNAATSVTAGFAYPIVRGVPITFRPGPTDANNHVAAKVVAAYLQDQVQIGPHLQLVAGVRFDRFELDFRNNRTGERLSRTDDLVSPRLGVVVKPAEPVSLYASYSVSYLPSAGDQFSSLTATSQALEPEEFENYELGAKWDVTPELSLSAAAYRLDRTNTTARDPNDPTVTIQTGAQRTRGLELAVTGQLTERWEVAGGYAWQDAEITSTTTTALAGKTVALTPRHTASLWNKVRLTERWGAGLGVVRQGRSFAAVDNTVVLPGYTRVDVAVFLKLNDRLRAQVNVENLFDRRYFPTSQGNNNILPGAPRSARVSLTANF